MDLNEYITIFLPFIKKAQEYKGDKNKTKSHFHYMYRVLFYGLDEVLLNNNTLVSSAALMWWNQKCPNEVLNLHDLLWTEQLKYDKQRAVLIREHIYTGTMFRNAISKINSDELTVKNVCEIIEANYKCAWILKSENSQLKKCDRGDDLKHALAHYTENKICLLEFDPISKQYNSLKK